MAGEQLVGPAAFEIEIDIKNAAVGGRVARAESACGWPVNSPGRHGFPKLVARGAW